MCFTSEVSGEVEEAEDTTFLARGYSPTESCSGFLGEGFPDGCHFVYFTTFARRLSLSHLNGLFSPVTLASKYHYFAGASCTEAILCKQVMYR